MIIIKLFTVAMQLWSHSNPIENNFLFSKKVKVMEIIRANNKKILRMNNTTQNYYKKIVFIWNNQIFHSIIKKL